MWLRMRERQAEEETKRRELGNWGKLGWAGGGVGSGRRDQRALCVCLSCFLQTSGARGTRPSPGALVHIGPGQERLLDAERVMRCQCILDPRIVSSLDPISPDSDRSKCCPVLRYRKDPPCPRRSPSPSTLGLPPGSSRLQRLPDAGRDREFGIGSPRPTRASITLHGQSSY